MSTKVWDKHPQRPSTNLGDLLAMKQFILDFIHAETSNRNVNTLSRALLAALAATAVAYLRSRGYPL